MTMRGRSGYEQRRERKRFKIYTNGTLTEFGYFENVKKIAYDIVETKPCRGKTFDKILEEAVRAKTNGDYDEVCIVIDIDRARLDKREADKLKAFLCEAEARGIPVYLSNECFEVWLNCHKISLSGRAAKRKEAQRLAKECGMVFEDKPKEVNPKEITKENIERALKEAARLRRVFGDNIFKDAPTTDVDELVSKITLI